MPVEAQTHVLAEAIEAAADPLLRAHGLTLVDLDLRRGGRRAVLRFYLDKPEGVGIDDCRRFSEEAGDLLAAAGLLPESCDLEVSSPGLDRELRKDRELRWAIGKSVRVWTAEPVDGRRELVGRLVEVGEDFLALAEGAGLRRVPRGILAKARLEVELPGSARPGGVR